MINLKITSSPRRLAIYTALIASFISGIVIVLNIFFDFGNKWLFLVFSLLLIFVVMFIVAYFIFNDIIVRKIRPIYKTINNLKADERHFSEPFDNDIIYEVNKEVINWVKEKSNEIRQLKKSEQFRKEFVANVAHELKTPLFNIQGYILTLLDGGLNDPKINKKYLKRTEKNINRLIATIKDVDTISRLESGVLKLNFQEFNIIQLIKEVFEMQDLTSSKYSIELKFDGSFDDIIMVYADKNNIFEILNNLVVNAIKYGKPNGSCFVKVKEDEKKVYVSVIDNGIGIDKEHLPMIFQRFYRIDKSRSRERGGSGLGLAIVKHIIEAHKEKIMVRSKLQEGTTFTFSLQRAIE